LNCHILFIDLLVLHAPGMALAYDYLCKNVLLCIKIFKTMQKANGI